MSKRTKPGFWSWWNGGNEVLEELRRMGYPRSMSKHSNNRVPIVGFWRKFGIEATVEAFHVSRSTLFRWKHELDLGQEIPRSTAPSRKRCRVVAPEITTAIILERTEHYGLGKDKVQPLLAGTCLAHDLPLPSISTVGRIIGDLKRAGRLSSQRQLRISARTGKLLEKQVKRVPKRRRKGYQPQIPGDLLQVDTVITIVDGRRRYTLTAIDLTSRFAFAWTYTNGSSKSATDFLAKLREVAPFEVRHLQTDNGSEFHGHFDQALSSSETVHFWNYPRYPKGNAYVERFNRTIQEEFLDYHRGDLVSNLDDLNNETIDWLIWYNTKRPHYGLHQQPPMTYLQRTTKKSHMWWTHTPA